MFEIAAATVLIGLISSVSLFGQYWGVLTGDSPYEAGGSSGGAEKPPAASAQAVPYGLATATLSTPLLLDKAREDDEAEAGGGPVSSAGSRSYWYNARDGGAFSERGVDEERQMTLAMAPTSNNIIIAPDSGMPFHFFQSPSE